MTEISPDQCTAIYLEEFKYKNPKNVKEILTALYSDSYNRAKETYSDSLCNDTQCGRFKDRSFDDIYYLCKSYLPAITVEELLHEILIYEIKPGYIFGLGSCGTIARIKLFEYEYKSLRNAWKDIYAAQIKQLTFDSQWSWK